MLGAHLDRHQLAHLTPTRPVLTTTMLPRPLSNARIRLIRPLRPPNPTHKAPRPRLFTQNSQLLLIASHTPRPQLPYLCQPAFRPAVRLGPSHQLARLLTTENRRYVRDQAWLAVKWTAVGWFGIACLGLAWFGWQTELQEREHPTPEEWSYWTRSDARAARKRQDPAFNGMGIVDWAAVGTDWRHCLEKLENFEKDGKGLALQGDDEVGILIPGVGRAGYDVSAKSWPWRQGYFEAIMGCAQAAEHLDDMVRDKTRGLVFPKEMLIGPSNPDPRPVPVGMNAAPLEENCDRPYAPPETFYLRVLTSRGFETWQKLDAALAYANWLEYKGLNDSALEMYRWGVDIARGVLPDAESIIDGRTGVLKVDEPFAAAPSPNVLRAATSLAVHHARTGAVSEALPIFLSVLRARRSAPVSPFAITQPNTRNADKQTTDYQSFLNVLGSIIRKPVYPAPPPSGDEPLIRSTEKPTCHEAELMLYIGEILFASSPSSEEGLGWTRRAVAIAEDGSNPTRASDAATLSDRKKCKECLVTGVGNWEAMLRRLAAEQVVTAEREGGSDGGWLRWGGWFGKDWQKAVTQDWQTELRLVQEKRASLARQGIDEEMSRSVGVPGGVWIG